MFRVVKVLDEGPSYFLLCDSRVCMEARRGTAHVANVDDFRLSRRDFLKAAIAEGWWVDIEGAYCPVHAREMLYAAKQAAEQGQQVVPATPGLVSLFGKGRAS